MFGYPVTESQPSLGGHSGTLAQRLWQLPDVSTCDGQLPRNDEGSSHEADDQGRPEPPPTRGYADNDRDEDEADCVEAHTAARSFVSPSPTRNRNWAGTHGHSYTRVTAVSSGVIPEHWRKPGALHGKRKSPSPTSR